VAIVIDNDSCAFDPFWAIGGNPITSCPFTNIISTGKNSGTLDISDFNNVLIL
jgi:hypothetical protein